MGLGSVGGAALSGLSTTQKARELVASKVADAGTPGYTRKDLALRPNYVGNGIRGVRTAAVTRSP